MNSFDIIVCTIIVLSGLVGAFRGFSREIFGLAAWVGSGILCYFLFPIAKNISHEYFTNAILSDIVSGLGTFLLFFIVFHIISNFFSVLTEMSIFGPVEWILGLFFGFSRGIIIIIFLDILASYFLDKSEYPQPVKESISSSYIFEASSYTFSLLPKTIREFLNIQRQKYDTILSSNSLKEFSVLKPNSNTIDDEDTSYSKKLQNNMDRFLSQ